MASVETWVKEERWSTNVSGMQNGADVVAGWRDSDRTWQCGSKGVLVLGSAGTRSSHFRRRHVGRCTVAKRYLRLR